MRRSCNNCLLDLTDACPRGAGRCVDDTACEKYIKDACAYCESIGEDRDENGNIKCAKCNGGIINE